MNKRICIVELYEHHEVVRILAKLFAFANYDVSIFAKQQVIDNLGQLTAKFVIQDTNQSQQSFIQTHLSQLNQADLILFTTLVKYPRFFANLVFKPPTILMVHDGNYFLRPNQHIQIKGIMDWARWLKFKLFQEEKYRKLLLQRFTYITFSDDFIAQNLDQEIKSLGINVLPALPLSFYESSPNRTQNSNKTTIVIPGSIKSTRDYNLVWTAFQQMNNIHTPIEIVFLGSGNSEFGRKTIARFRKLEKKDLKIIAKETFFTQEEFDFYMRRASFAIIPIKKKFVAGIFKEEYGKTKITGSVNDVIRFGVPTLISGFYPISSKLFIPFHDTKDLTTWITKWISTNPLEQQLVDYQSIQATFSLTKMSNKIIELENHFAQK